ncbi:MAG: ABC transporter ATP-binding protein [Candidatus Muproteobacteria bacterium RIFCSPHIGHO2_01_FULL_65_16]|uniref:ABC transporter ATP-binding protein n=1 Tax=Candidatus Muproteobacteria bacterium RIFCSPHIGHO2_01_FULL_65_16 TaxID=1817764 RepID=A0A1F6TNI2_9PROT|nr:MAG: ABC transporter ATP-binding protein [Candidatus Muproteobacteria bacterium RIFCSPHIGHO2_01_FULL_65_16]
MNQPRNGAAKDDVLVDIRDVQFARGDRPILKGVTMAIRRGSVTAIMGGSGCGKTTLLNLIGGSLKPDSGAILVDGISVPDLSTNDLFELRKRMALLFQTGALFTDLSLFENVAFPIREHTRLPEPILRKVVLMKLETVGLRGARDLMPSELSGGMARRAALARAIALEPMMIMYDEPFTGLDPISKGVIGKLIRELNQSLGITSIVVSHDVAETCLISDYAYLMGDGRIMGEGTPAEVQRSGSEHVRQFMDGLPDGPVPYQYPAEAYLEDLTRWNKH